MHPQLASLHNKTKLVTNMFVIFVYKNLKENNLQNNKGLFLWLKQDRGSWFYYISLSHKCGGDEAQTIN
jgi:hypothetical protein